MNAAVLNKSGPVAHDWAVGMIRQEMDYSGNAQAPNHLRKQCLLLHVNDIAYLS